MEGLAENVKEVTGKEEEGIEALVVAVPVMTTMVEDMEVSVVTVVKVVMVEDMEAHNSSKEGQVTEALEDMVDHNSSKEVQAMEVLEVKVALEMALKVTGELIYILK